ncbi:hypothetical protein WJX73_009059, partial [Symbiochloris irregularis]
MVLMGKSGSDGALSAELHAVFVAHVLPKLDREDLGRISCTSKEFRHLAELAGPDAWQAAARQLLPASHPAQKSTQVPFIRAAWSSYKASQKAFHKGRMRQYKYTTAVPQALELPKWAPNGRDFAVVFAADPWPQDVPQIERTTQQEPEPAPDQQEYTDSEESDDGPDGVEQNESDDESESVEQ